MAIENNFEDYKNEIELIIKQNPFECELYSIIAAIMRGHISSKNCSLRDVTYLRNQRKDDIYGLNIKRYRCTDIKGKLMFTKKGRELYGSADFLIIDRKYTFSGKDNSRDLIYGCIEVKALYESLKTDINNDNQLREELKTFGKLLYTNGLEWRFYKKDKDGSIHEKPFMECKLGEYVLSDKENNKVSANDKIKWADEKMWTELLKKLDEINWEEKI